MPGEIQTILLLLIIIIIIITMITVMLRIRIDFLAPFWENVCF